MTVLQDLTAANTRIGNRLVNSAGTLAKNAFLNLGSWRDADVDRYINQIAPTLTGIKLQASRSTVAFYKAMADLNGEDWTGVVSTASDVSTKALRRGVGSEIVYKRPFVDMRTALANGQSMTDAINAGALRAQQLASTEVQLARQNAGLKARNANDRIVGFIRTLSGMENCALCYVASTQRYTRGDLLPIHPGCDCGEMPIYGTQDPGQVINEVRLDAAHEAVNTRFGAWAADARTIDYRAIKIVEHGEMGPLLTIKGQSALGAGDVGELFGNTRVIGELSLDEKNAIHQYGTTAYRPINAGLRDGWDVSTNPAFKNYYQVDVDEAKLASEYIDSAMSKTALAKDVTVLRGAQIPELKNLTDSQLIGMTITDAGFLSTTTGNFQYMVDKMTSYTTQRQVFEIKVPKGSQAIDMNGLELAKYDYEQELILPRGTKLKITGVIEKPYTFRGSAVDSNGNKYIQRIIQAEVVPNA